MPSPRALLVFVVSLIVVFGASFGIGYVYQYDPERDVVELVIDGAADVPSEGTLTSGVVRGVDGSTVTIETETGTIEISIGEVGVEALLPLDDPSVISAGTTVNLGGERTPTERVISGLVFLDGGVQQ